MFCIILVLFKLTETSSTTISYRILRRLCILPLMSGLFYRCYVRLVYSVFHIFYLLADLSSCFIYYWRYSVEVSNYSCWIIYFSFQFCHFSLHVFWGSIVGCIYLLIMYSWWIDPLVIINVMLSLIIIFILKSDINISHSSSLLDTACMVYLFISFYFQLICIFESKYVSSRHHEFGSCFLIHYINLCHSHLI